MENISNRKECSFIRGNLYAFFEKTLPPADEQRFINHIESCKDCNRIYTDFQSVISQIDGKKLMEPNPFVQTRILQRLETQETGKVAFFRTILKRAVLSTSISLLFIIAVITGYLLVIQNDTRFLNKMNYENIQAMKSDMNIPDFIDEDHILSNDQQQLP